MGASVRGDEHDGNFGFRWDRFDKVDRSDRFGICSLHALQTVLLQNVHPDGRPGGL